MGKFITEVGLEIRDRQIVGGYSMLPDGLSVAECTSEGGTVFSTGDWKVLLKGSTPATSNSRIYIAGDTYRRGLDQTHGWLLLGTREGRKSTKFVPNTDFVELEVADLVEETAPDGEYDFEFNVADDRYTVLTTDGSCKICRYKDMMHRPRVSYAVDNATWVAYVSSQGKHAIHESTLITELSLQQAESEVKSRLEELDAVDLVDLLDIWSDLVDPI